MSTINPELPTLSIHKQKLTLSKNAKEVLWCGTTYPTVTFVNVIVPSLLGYLPPNSAGANNLLSEMNANGFSISGYSRHHAMWVETMRYQREEQLRRQREVEQHRERMAAINASPAEIAAEVAERRAREADIARRFGNKGADFGL